MINQSKPTTTLAGTVRPMTYQTWDDNTSTWDTETRNWDQMGTLLENTEKPTQYGSLTEGAPIGLLLALTYPTAVISGSEMVNISKPS